MKSLTNRGFEGWISGPSSPRLTESQVHVWRASLDVSSEVLRSLEESLTDDERTRANHFSFERLRRRFVARRGLLRELLASYVQAEPRELRFAYGNQDKPRLVGEPAWEAMSFNVTHSQGWALYAVTLSRDIGIDLERIRPEVEALEIADRYFTQSEAEAITRAPVGGRSILFFKYWTCKEAWIKAMGGGLSIPLDGFQIVFGPEECTARVVDLKQPDGDSPWFVHQLMVGSEHAAAVAVDDPGLEFQLWDWAPEVERRSVM